MPKCTSSIDSGGTCTPGYSAPELVASEERLCRTQGSLGMTIDPSLWQMVPGCILCTHSSLSSGSLALPDCGDRELVLL